MAKKRMMLYFGSFNPVHRGHTALAEYAVEKGLCDEVAMIISPQNPFKQDAVQAPEMDRYAMVEIACRNSRFPNHIVPSVIEFLLEKPSYTINTLRHLKENYGDIMEFKILIGSDLINTLPQWREAEEIIAGYDIFVYPRPGVEMTYSTPRTTFLADAPQYDYSSTQIREALEQGGDITRMIDGEVAGYIREKGLWRATK
ncbi:MAG: nicotinate (nicotinamide) nucleotide adenylyltransferase [Alistipes sp.]|nr:nicotinate (nicotinamide) nucleotide adenylyltransferase [Alistipes sp.]